MSIEVIYRVLKTNGELAGEYMDKKLADSHDQKLDCIYTITDLMLEASKALDADTAEGIAEHLVNNKQTMLDALKKVKEFTKPQTEMEFKESSNVETLDTGKLEINKKVASA
ncbi:YebG family protein [Aurantivibrio infirmus]